MAKNDQKGGASDDYQGELELGSISVTENDNRLVSSQMQTNAVDRLAKNPSEFKKYMFMNQLAKRYGNLCVAFEALDVYKKGRIKVNEFIIACVSVCGVETDIEAAKSLFHCFRQGKIAKVHLCPKDFGISPMEWDKYQAQKLKLSYGEYKRKGREVRKNDILGMRVTNFGVPPDQIGRVLFPGGLHVQNWKIDPGVKKMLHKNRSLTEEINMKNILLSQVVDKCEELQAQLVTERMRDGAAPQMEQKERGKQEYTASTKGALLGQIMECCERNNTLLEAHKNFMQSLYSKLQSIEGEGTIPGSGTKPGSFHDTQQTGYGHDPLLEGSHQRQTPSDADPLLTARPAVSSNRRITENQTDRITKNQSPTSSSRSQGQERSRRCENSSSSRKSDTSSMGGSSRKIDVRSIEYDDIDSLGEAALDALLDELKVTLKEQEYTSKKDLVKRKKGPV